MGAHLLGDDYVKDSKIFQWLGDNERAGNGEFASQAGHVFQLSSKVLVPGPLISKTATVYRMKVPTVQTVP